MVLLSLGLGDGGVEVAVSPFDTVDVPLPAGADVEDSGVGASEVVDSGSVGVLFSDAVLAAMKSRLGGWSPVDLENLADFLRRGMSWASFLTSVSDGVTFDVLLPTLRRSKPHPTPPPPPLRRPTSVCSEEDGFLTVPCVISLADLYVDLLLAV